MNLNFLSHQPIVYSPRESFITVRRSKSVQCKSLEKACHMEVEYYGDGDGDGVLYVHLKHLSMLKVDLFVHVAY